MRISDWSSDVCSSDLHKGYGPNCWGLTACDGDAGYGAFNPEEDRGVIAPTAALSAMPYTPQESMATLRYFYEELGGEIWGRHGFVDAFNRSQGWVANSNLAIDQGPVVVMIDRKSTRLNSSHYCESRKTS